MNVGQLLDILESLDPTTKIKIKIDTWDLRNKDCYISSVELFSNENGSLQASLNYKEEVQENE